MKRSVALFFALILTATFVCAAFGLDLGCADDCERGRPCPVACLACGCSAVVTAAQPLSLAPAASREPARPALVECPRSGIVRAVLHVPLAPASPSV